MKICIDEPLTEMSDDLISVFQHRKTQAFIDSFKRRKTASYENDRDFFNRIFCGFMNFWHFTSGGFSTHCTFRVSNDFFNHYNYISYSFECKGLYNMNMLNRSVLTLPLATGPYEAWRWSSAYTFNDSKEKIKNHNRRGIMKHTTNDTLKWSGFVSVFDRSRFIGDNYDDTLSLLEKDITDAFEKGIQVSLWPYSPFFSHLMHGRKIIRRKRSEPVILKNLRI